jgi:hypothetical protein
VYIKGRGVTGAEEAVLFRFPVNGAAEMGAAPIDSQEAATGSVHEVETAAESDDFLQIIQVDALFREAWLFAFRA